MVQVEIITAFGPSKLQEFTNAKLKELHDAHCVIYRVERIIYDVVNEIYTLMIVYQLPVDTGEKFAKLNKELQQR